MRGHDQAIGCLVSFSRKGELIEWVRHEYFRRVNLGGRSEVLS